ncbi:MAG: nucleoside deaminase [Deltaproteobacteria bacterium]|nr:nucleoside deaminase [Deltaproteobacteria bacterium]
MQLKPGFLKDLMQASLAEAKRAASFGEVPVGAVVAQGKEIIAFGRNEMELRCDPTAHAEVLAIRRATQVLGNWRLTESVLCVTLEPCTMCMGAIRLARIPVIVYGARDERMGAAGSLYDLSLDSRLGAGPRIISGICEKEAAEVLSEFFQHRRDERAETLQ